ncbi:hypothetical protein NVT68_002310 [Clostridium botulinum]|uniref:hypothetical protein n=1 Tax=Clostridium TaxID=1485 RepID=UPI001F333DD0|nr:MULTISPECIES: hypothetical protein [Clostridium]MDI6918460.1 hypothetical protein [Clostridium botulinum]
MDEAKLKKVLGSLRDSELEIIQKGFLILSEGGKKILILVKGIKSIVNLDVI